MRNRINILQYPSNDPCEDRFQAAQLKSIPGFYAAVFDGHGGWQVSNFLMKHLDTILDKHLKTAKSSKEIIEAISSAFDEAEEACYTKLKGAFDIGFPKAGSVGS